MATQSTPPVPKPRKSTDLNHMTDHPCTGKESPGASPKPKPKRFTKDGNGTQQARPYQLELLDAAIEQNTIVNLGTGAGKTFIAVMLIKELSSSILLPFKDDDAKRTVFLVTTVPLVAQQAGYIRTHTCLEVGEYVGEKGVDSWSVNRWHCEFDTYQVLVMTMTIFKNLIMQTLLPLSKVNLVVFDECHHAVKNHDYVQIMRLFKPHIEAGDEIPHILGLTASLIPSKCKPGDIELKIKELETTLSARSQTAEDLQQVALYATNPDEQVLRYESSSKDVHISELNQILDGPVSFLESFKKSQREGTFYDTVKLYLDDLSHILVNLGVWCADKFAREGLRVVEGEIRECGNCFVDEWEKSLMYFARTQLEIFVKKSKEKLKIARETEQYPTTSKVKQLAHYLGDTAVTSGDLCLDDSDTVSSKPNADKLLGIIFVERRTTAFMLTRLLQHLKDIDSDLKHIKCEPVVGHNSGKKGTHLRRESQMPVRKQFEVLEKFRREKINLLISTSVVEEGVDVPRCNNVIRFDFPQNFRAYIQSKGRARAKKSKYLLLINNSDMNKVNPDLIDYRILEKELQSICLGRTVPNEEEIMKRMEEVVGPYMPFGRDGPVAMLGTSLSLVHKYCQKLPKDHYTILVPSFKTEKIECPQKTAAARNPEEDILYQSTLTFPMNCPLKEPIQGLPMPTRRIADKSAALEAVKLLHMAKELDEYLRPFTKNEDSDVDDEEKMVEKRFEHAGTEKRHHYYPNKVASTLSGCFPVTGTGNFLYLFLIREKDTGTFYQCQSEEAFDEVPSFGLLTKKELPHSKVPEFTLFASDKQLQVTIHKYHHTVSDITETELFKLKICHDALFTQVLKIGTSCLRINFDSPTRDYLIVPVKIILTVQPLEAYLDMEMVETIARLKTPPETSAAVSSPSKAWPVSIVSFNDCLVTDIHMPLDRRKLLEVLKVNKDIKPTSKFPDPFSAASFEEYFRVKYDYPLTDFKQPALKCKFLGLKEKRLKMLSSNRFKDRHEHSRKVPTREIILFPELCSIYPIPASLWKLMNCIPSILWRMESTLCADEFRMAVAQETGLGVSLPGPDSVLLLSAFTPKGANDEFNLERLETLGDSFLKLVTSIFLFHDRQIAHEGRLSSARSRRVGNLNLFLLAKRKRIADNILSTSFEPCQMWIPPCFSFDKGDPESQQPVPAVQEDTSLEPLGPARHYLFHKVTDKGVADCVEALIGAYLVSGGIDAALKFMKWVGIKITSENDHTEAQPMEEEPKDEELTSSSSSDSATPPISKRTKTVTFQNPYDRLCRQQRDTYTSLSKLPLFIKNSSSIFNNHFPSSCKPRLDRHQANEVEKMLQKSFGTYKGLAWLSDSVKDRSLLLQALTHASYVKNRVTDCYQRLEFLGDAVLDYLVTCHIYSRFPDYDPGQISGMRAALVNNNTFAEFVVKLNLHKALLHNSPSLFHQISRYVSTLEIMDDSTEHVHFVVTDGNADCTLKQEMILEGPTDDEDDVEEIEPPKVLGDILESLAGAIFIDSDLCLDKVWEIFRPLFDDRIDSFKGKVPIFPIQELFQREPSAQTKSTRIGSGCVRCTITLVDPESKCSRKFSARSKTIKSAKMAAARAALREMDRC